MSICKDIITLLWLSGEKGLGIVLDRTHEIHCTCHSSQPYKHINLGSLRIRIPTVVFESHFWPHKDNSWPVLGISVWNQTNSWLSYRNDSRLETKTGIHLYGLHNIMITGHLRSKTIVTTNDNARARCHVKVHI